MSKLISVGEKSAVDLAAERVVAIGRDLGIWQTKLSDLEARIADAKVAEEDLTRKRAPLVLRAKTNGDQAAQRDLDRLTEEMFHQAQDLSDLQLAAAQIGEKIAGLEDDQQDAIRWKMWANFQVLATQRMEMAKKIQAAFKTLVPLIEGHLRLGRDMNAVAVPLNHDSAGNYQGITGELNLRDFITDQLSFLGEIKAVPSYKKGADLTDMEAASLEKISHLENRRVA